MASPRCELGRFRAAARAGRLTCLPASTGASQSYDHGGHARGGAFSRSDVGDGRQGCKCHCSSSSDDDVRLAPSGSRVRGILRRRAGDRCVSVTAPAALAASSLLPSSSAGLPRARDGPPQAPLPTAAARRAPLASGDHMASSAAALTRSFCSGKAPRGLSACKAPGVHRQPRRCCRTCSVSVASSSVSSLSFIRVQQRELGGAVVWRRSGAPLPPPRAREARIAAVRTRPKPLRVAAGLALRRLLVA